MNDNQPAKFDLRSLAPTRPVFTDLDGHEHAFALPGDLSLEQEAERYALLSARMDAINRLSENRGDVATAREIAASLDTELQILLPTLDAEQRARLRDRDKMAILAWWNEHALVPTGGAAASGRPPTTTSAKRSRGSATRSAATASATSAAPHSASSGR